MQVSGQLHAPVAFPLEREPSTHWVDPRAGLDAVGETKIFSCWELTPNVQLVADLPRDSDENHDEP
jgi:hypothetical protein